MCWKLTNNLIFPLCFYSCVESCRWVAVRGILMIGSVGAENGLPDTVAYSAAGMRSPRITCLPLPNIFDTVVLMMLLMIKMPLLRL